MKMEIVTFLYTVVFINPPYVHKIHHPLCLRNYSIYLVYYKIFSYKSESHVQTYV